MLVGSNIELGIKDLRLPAKTSEIHNRTGSFSALCNPLDVHKGDVFALRVRCRCSTSGAVRTVPLPLPLVDLQLLSNTADGAVRCSLLARW